MSNEELVQLYQNGDKQALNSIIENNIGIVHKLANSFYVTRINSVDKDDLVQEGFLGLITATKKYDINNPKKANFITYAIFWISSKIRRFIYNRDTNDEISIDAPIKENKNIELSETIRDKENCYENIEDKLYYKQLRKELNETMNTYNTLMEREILKLKYGWDNDVCMTLLQIGDIFNISQRNINSIKDKALRHIRNSPWGHKKAKEYYITRFSDCDYNINKKIQAIDFERKYLAIIEH